MQVPATSHIESVAATTELEGVRDDQDPPEEFTDAVRDALISLYDVRRLKSHALLAALASADPSPASGAATLRRVLLDAIETLNPGSGVSASSRAWRLYRILDLRYLEGREVHEVMAELALSKSQYHRDHHHALRTVAAALWEQRPGDRSDQHREPDLTRREAELLRTEAPAGSVDPTSVINEVERLLRPLCSPRQVELALDLPEALPVIRGDRVALRHALLAILTPAVRATERDVVLVEGRAGDGRLRIAVSGAATMKAVELERALAESAPFVDALGGSIVMSPRPATRPWTVTLSFPAVGRPLLLVVDNSADFIRLVDRFLAGYAWEVAGASNVDQAFAVAMERRPSAILLDIVLPGRDGWDLLVELKGNEATRDLPVIICSVLGEADVAVTLGATACLHKPVTAAQLVEALRPFEGG